MFQSDIPNAGLGEDRGAWVTSHKWILGVDGGGTKTTAILVGEDGTFGAQESAGGASLTTVGIDAAAKIVFDLARKCCSVVSCSAEQLHAVGVGLAGAGRAVDRDELHRMLNEQGRRADFPFSKIVVEPDWRVALEGAYPVSPGVVLIAGTGSIGCARGEDKTLHRIGGWGRILDDAGSAYALGRDGLQAGLRAQEGLGDATILAEYALQHFDVASFDDLVGKVYRGAADVASFASKIFVAASQRDHIAHAILSRGAGALVEIVRALIMKIQPKRRIPVALMGGLLEKENVYSALVKERLVGTLPQVFVQKPKFPAAYGAAILAFQPFLFPQ